MSTAVAERLPRHKHRDIRLTLTIKAPAGRVYRALTSARELCAWWLERAETDARNGGRVRMVWPPAADGDCPEASGVFVDLEPGRKAAWIWDAKSRRRGVPLLNSVFLEAEGRGTTKVTVVHAGFASRPSGAHAYALCVEAWEDCLAKLSLYLESGRTGKDQRMTLAGLALMGKRSGR